jgi:hypothetical protein
MYQKLMLIGVATLGLPLMGCSSHHHHDRDDEHVVYVPRERVKYREDYDRHDERYRDRNYGRYDDDRCR